MNDLAFDHAARDEQRLHEVWRRFGIVKANVKDIKDEAAATSSMIGRSASRTWIAWSSLSGPQAQTVEVHGAM